jgi:hypothetical protein
LLTGTGFESERHSRLPKPNQLNCDFAFEFEKLRIDCSWIATSWSYPLGSLCYCHCAFVSGSELLTGIGLESERHSRLLKLNQLNCDFLSEFE